MSRTRGEARRAPAALGIDGPEVLKALGYDDAEIARLRAEGILVVNEPEAALREGAQA